jgi:cytochrome c oxidase assembly protein subunit 15
VGSDREPATVVPRLTVGRDASVRAKVVFETGWAAGAPPGGEGGAAVVGAAVDDAAGRAVVAGAVVVGAAAITGAAVPMVVPEVPGGVGTGASDGAGALPLGAAVAGAPLETASVVAPLHALSSATVESTMTSSAPRPAGAGRRRSIPSDLRGPFRRPRRASADCRASRGHRYPGAVLGLRVSPQLYRRITLFALLALVFIVVTGAGVRLTSSGLGCTDWPACSDGQLVAELEFHPMIEFVNRMITGLVSAAVIVAVLASLLRDPRRRDLTWLSVGLVGGVLVQIVLGGIVVKVGLKPVFVTLHYLASILLVWDAYVLHHRAGQPEGPAVPVVGPRIVALGRALVALSLLVLVTGTFVTGSGPHAGDVKAERYGFAIGDVARIHGIAVWCFLAVAVVTLWRLARSGAPVQVDRHGRWLVAAIVAQGAIGYTQYFTGVPPALVLVHILGSVLVFLAALSFHLSLFTRSQAPAPDLPEASLQAAQR